MVSGKAKLPERRDAFAVDVEYAATASESVVGAGDAGVVVTYHDGIAEEKPGAESRRKILACVHVEKTTGGEDTARYLGGYLKKPPIAASGWRITTEGEPEASVTWTTKREKRRRKR